MKIEIERDALLGALRQVVDVVASRNTIAVLGNLLLVAEDGNLTLTGTDLNLQASARVAAAGAMRTTVDKNKLLAAVVSLKPGSIAIESGKGAALVLKQGRGQRTLQTLPATDFPKREPLKGATEFRMPAASLARLFDATTPAISSEEARPYLCGVFLHVIDNRLRAAATDGHRLIRAEMTAPDGADGMPDAIVPTKAVSQMRKVLQKAEGDVSISVTPSAISFETGQTHILTKLVDGTYPDYSRVIPTATDTPIVFVRDAMIEPVHAVSAVLNAEGDKIKSRMIRIELRDGDAGHEVSGSDSAGAAAQEPLDAEYRGQPMVFWVNGQYAASVLGVFAESGQMRLSIANPVSPALITSEKDPDLLAVVMPMRA